MNKLQLQLILASLEVLSRNFDQALEIANGDYFDQGIIDATTDISCFAHELPEEVKMRFRKALGTEGDVMSMNYAASDIRVCIKELNDWIKELKPETE